MFEQYLKERKGVETIQTKEGFIAFKIESKVCMIHEIYTLPKFRKNHVARELADLVFAIAKENHCVEVQCIVDLRANGVETSMLAILHYGFKAYQCEGTNIVRFYKEV